MKLPTKCEGCLEVKLDKEGDEFCKDRDGKILCAFSINVGDVVYPTS